MKKLLLLAAISLSATLAQAAIPDSLVGTYKGQYARKGNCHLKIEKGKKGSYKLTTWTHKDEIKLSVSSKKLAPNGKNILNLANRKGNMVGANSKSMKLTIENGLPVAVYARATARFILLVATDRVNCRNLKRL